MDNSQEAKYIGYLSSPIGLLEIAGDGQFITSIQFLNDAEPKQIDKPNDLIQDCIKQLDEYFGGNRKVFDLPLKPTGTDFQYKVWDRISEVPFGMTSSYGLISKLLGNFKLTRAVGLANGANPIPIIIPCHRIIGSDGSLTGYAGGLDKKKWLLNHEQRYSKFSEGQLKLF
ncbi:MAG: methylated-DNA--[protein]-cysteine S-methyltransferase [Bacteroidales bacterium]|nr:methylated-DNA--[protein]-cysteine S-methyltransferase [Bacteroidales bacterium]